MILSVGLNPVFDLFVGVERLRLGGCAEVLYRRRTCGGKSLNFVRAARRLGFPCRIAGFLGGNGAPFKEALHALDVPCDFVECADDIGTNVNIIQEDAPHMPATVLADTPRNAPPPEAREKLLRLIDSAPCDMLVFNGVPPTEWTAEFCSRAAKSAAKRGIAVAADCGGGALAAITEAVRPVLIKRNAAELETAAGAAPTGFSDIAGAARALNRGGARYVFAHLGGDGVIAVGGGAAYSAQYAHDLPKSGPDAGGDAMFAAACGTIVSGGGILEALSAAAAAATAAALAAPSGEADAELFGKIRKNIRITAL